MLKAVLFDLDGTLLDTVPDIRSCVNGMLARRGYPAISYAQTCAFVGDGAKPRLQIKAASARNDNRLAPPENIVERGFGQLHVSRHVKRLRRLRDVDHVVRHGLAFAH